MELTARMLATLFDYPQERRHQLIEWSDKVTACPESTGGDTSSEEIFELAMEASKEFAALWHEKAARKEAGE